MAVLPRVACALAAMCTVLAGGSPARAYTIKTTDSGETVHWVQDHVVMRLDPRLEEYFVDLPIRVAVTASARAWQGLPAVPEVLINEGAPGERGFDAHSEQSNGVYLLEEWPLAESSLAVTVATFESNTGRMVDADILVNATHPFSLLEEDPAADPTAQFDLQGVMTHEMGHVLGLGESYNERMATMWPNIARGELHQRSIHQDDQSGVTELYARTLADRAYAANQAAEGAQAPLGCAGASVTGKGARHGLGVWALLLVGLGVLVLVTRRAASRSWRRSGPALGLIVLFGAPFDPSVFDARALRDDDQADRVLVARTLALRNLAPAERAAGLREATTSPSAAVRLAAAAVLERAGTLGDVALASALAADPDDRVAAAGAAALRALRTAPPAARIKPEHPDAARRLASLMDGAISVHRGRAQLRNVVKRGGMLWSRYVVDDGSTQVEVEIPGGALAGYTQVVSEQELPPDGAELLIAEREGRATGWAFARQDLLYGGWLGHGPAIEWAR